MIIEIKQKELQKLLIMAKKEVFDDIDKEFSKPAYLNDKNPYQILQELRKKHLRKKSQEGN